MVLNFDYGIQLSIIHVSKYCLIPATFYPSVVILRGGEYMGIELNIPPDTLVRWILYFVTPAPIFFTKKHRKKS